MSTSTATRRATIFGRVILTAQLRAVTGLRIGGATGTLAIGALDNPVVRDPLTNQPYIPGSALKGKLRSLSERIEGLVSNWRINNVYLHICLAQNGQNPNYHTCPVCPVFGVPGDQAPSAPTRLIVRDAFLIDESARELEALRLDLPYSEIKWEAAIDRVTSAATPRQVERVPAGARFACEMVYTIYEPEDFERFRIVARALQLLEDDYLGGYGSRGSGKVAFSDITLLAKPREQYDKPRETLPTRTFPSVDALLQQLDETVAWLTSTILVTTRDLA
ncbi:type III-A CRISPR-associated RAMP protein Csm3 [Thermorudis peleae]|uniref:type III-A CRISPR-associated RAMP protein Csm3 n=1 Tax=Thermorudis peleae TaxID=1382356 RepID=UPI00068C414C|nr:type III-A CRISPR-associated RAMP protein Csm3 [Thermorudis peleae]